MSGPARGVHAAFASPTVNQLRAAGLCVLREGCLTAGFGPHSRNPRVSAVTTGPRSII
jgi:hypothetical protein